MPFCSQSGPTCCVQQARAFVFVHHLKTAVSLAASDVKLLWVDMRGALQLLEPCGQASVSSLACFQTCHVCECVTRLFVGAANQKKLDSGGIRSDLLLLDARLILADSSAFDLYSILLHTSEGGGGGAGVKNNSAPHAPSPSPSPSPSPYPSSFVAQMRAEGAVPIIVELDLPTPLHVDGQIEVERKCMRVQLLPLIPVTASSMWRITLLGITGVIQPSFIPCKESQYSTPMCRRLCMCWKTCSRVPAATSTFCCSAILPCSTCQHQRCRRPGVHSLVFHVFVGCLTLVFSGYDMRSLANRCALQSTITIQKFLFILFHEVIASTLFVHFNFSTTAGLCCNRLRVLCTFCLE